jgi:hypothetical protein
MVIGNPPPLSIRTDEEDYQILYQCTYGNPPPLSSLHYTSVNDGGGGLLTPVEFFGGVAVPVILDTYVNGVRIFFQNPPVEQYENI